MSSWSTIDLNDWHERERVLAAWIQSAAYPLELSSSYRLRHRGPVWVEERGRPFSNPIPRQFEFNRLFNALADDAEAVAHGVREVLDSVDEEHVLNAFGLEGEAIAHRFSPYGYELAWLFSLYGFEPQGELPQPELEHPDWVIRPVRVIPDVAAINAQGPDYPSYVELVGDPRAYEVMVLEGERPIAKGFFVEHTPGIVHVLGMFTVPEYRRRGLARAVIRALHLEAQRRQVSLCVLNPSLMAARHGVYAALGYRTLMQGARLVPS